MRVFIRRSVLALILIGGMFFLWPGVSGEEPTPFNQRDTVTLSDQVSGSSPDNNGYLKRGGETQVNGLIGLLQVMGLDISYGSNGETIFSMVDQSLTRIISDLSSGNTEGFTDIPLISETLTYLGIDPSDIIVNPDDTPPLTQAVDRFNAQYTAKSNSSQ